MTFVTILSRVEPLAHRKDLVTAAAVEASIVNHCRANMQPFMDAAHAEKLQRAEMAAQDRYDILMEMLS